MAKQNTYDQNAISSLKGADRVRLRPGVIFGSADIRGCAHSVFEILSNSVDEAKEGYGSEIKLSYRKDGSLTIEDHGRGIPLDWNENEQRYNWELVFCELYAGGKYGDSSYGDSLGLNGLGACATQYASEYMNVTAYRDGLKYEIKFEKGEPVTDLVKTPCDRETTGTIIEFKPDTEVFDEIVVSREHLVDVFRRQAMLNNGIKFILQYEGKKDLEFEYANGIIEYVEDILDDDKSCKIISDSFRATGSDRPDRPDYEVKIETALAISRKHQLIELYHNSSSLEYGGIHYKALRNAITKAFTDALAEDNELKKDSKIQFKDVEDSLVCVISTRCPGNVTDYENQTKKSITNKFIHKELEYHIEHMLKEWFFANPEDAKKLLKEIVINKQTRESAEMTRQKVFKKLKSGNDKLLDRPEKLVECDTKVVAEKELYILEGDSALGSCKLARNALYQALMPVRGKTMNCLKADIIKIMQSEIILDLIKVLGCGVEVSDKHLKKVAGFDITKLNYGKIILCTDADVDGYQIRTLLLTLFYRLMPALLEQGYIYIVESPLYEIVYGANKDNPKILFAYDDKEKEKIMEQIKDEKNIKINRSKGLGENDPDMMWKTTMNPDTRRLINVKYEQTPELIATFNALLGDDIEGRRVRIQEYAEENDIYKVGDI